MNKTSNQNFFISMSNTANIIDAACFAELCGLSFTRFLSLDMSGISGRPQPVISHFLKCVSCWLRTKGVRSAYVWVLEYPARGRLNCHMLLHVPEALKSAFARKERRWLGQAGMPWRRDMLVSTKIGIRSGANNRALTDGERLVNLEYVLSYILKGAERETCDRLEIKWGPQGTILGKRCGTSQSIGARARTAAGYQPRPSERGVILFKKRYRLSQASRPSEGRSSVSAHP